MTAPGRRTSRSLMNVADKREVPFQPAHSASAGSADDYKLSCYPSRAIAAVNESKLPPLPLRQSLPGDNPSGFVKKSTFGDLVDPFGRSATG